MLTCNNSLINTGPPVNKAKVYNSKIKEKIEESPSPTTLQQPNGTTQHVYENPPAYDVVGSE